MAVETIIVTDTKEFGEGDKRRLVVTGADGRQFSTFDQARFDEIRRSRSIQTEPTARQYNGHTYWNLGKEFTCTPQSGVNPYPGTSGAGLGVRDLSIHRQVALKAAIEVAGLCGWLGGQEKLYARTAVLQLAEDFRRWLDQDESDPGDIPF